MDVVLKFDLNNPEDGKAYQLAFKGAALSKAMTNFEIYLNERMKTGGCTPALDEIHNEYYNELNKVGISSVASLGRQKVYYE